MLFILETPAFAMCIVTDELPTFLETGRAVGAAEIVGAQDGTVALGAKKYCLDH